MEIKGTRDMINYRNYLLTKVNIEYNKLEKLGNSPFTNRKEKNIISKNISDYRYELNSIEELMIKGSKFKSSDFAVFLEKFISLTENDVVTTTIKIADDAINERLYQKIRNTKDRSKLDKFIGKLYYFICDEERLKIVLENTIRRNLDKEYDNQKKKESK